MQIIKINDKTYTLDDEDLEPLGPLVFFGRGKIYKLKEAVTPDEQR